MIEQYLQATRLLGFDQLPDTLFLIHDTQGKDELGHVVILVGSQGRKRLGPPLHSAAAPGSS